MLWIHIIILLMKKVFLGNISKALPNFTPNSFHGIEDKISVTPVGSVDLIVLVG